MTWWAIIDGWVLFSLFTVQLFNCLIVDLFILKIGFQTVFNRFINTNHFSFPLFHWTFLNHTAVQHERAPRSCVPNPHLVSGLGVSHRPFSPTQHMPFQPHQYHGGLMLPMPLHLSSAFSTLDSQLPRHYPHLNAFQSNVIDSLHFAASNAGLFPPPPPLISGNSTLPIKPSLDSNPYLCRFISPLTSKNESELINEKPKPLSLLTLPKGVKDLTGKEDEVSSSEEILTIHTRLATTSTSNSSSSQEVVFESAAKLLFLAVRWTKSIPSFNQLNANDQNLLLEECWAELFVIMSAQYGLPIESETFIQFGYSLRKIIAFLLFCSIFFLWFQI